MSEPTARHALRGLALMFFSCFIIYCGACVGTPMQRGRTVISASAQAVVAVDRIMAPRYAAVMGASVVDPEVVQRWNRAVESLLLTRSAILVAEATLDAVDAGEEHDLRGVMGCIVVALQRLIEALPTVGVDVPATLTMALGLLGSFAGSCEAEDHTALLGVPHVSEAIAVGGAQ